MVPVGGHLGRDKTYYKIAERFHWKMLWKDVETYIMTCSVCQTTNDAKFLKEAAPLHPIPVKAEVWRQVCCCMPAVQLHGGGREEGEKREGGGRGKEGEKRERGEAEGGEGGNT